MAINWKSVMHRLWRRWLLPLAIIVVITCSFRSAVADWNDVPTGSMNPTILEGDRVFVNKLAYGLKVPFTNWYVATWGTPQRGDIVTFDSPADGKQMVKRVIGLPGDSLELRNNRLFINGKESQYASDGGSWRTQVGTAVGAVEDLWGRPHEIQLLPALPSKRNYGPLVVPDGHYFMMGDNRDNSMDSRYFGFVPADSIKGRAMAVALSLDPLDHYMPRWKRFGNSLK